LVGIKSNKINKTLPYIIFNAIIMKYVANFFIKDIDPIF